jgi:hypothetical protein
MILKKTILLTLRENYKVEYKKQINYKKKASYRENYKEKSSLLLES